MLRRACLPALVLLASTIAPVARAQDVAAPPPAGTSLPAPSATGAAPSAADGQSAPAVSVADPSPSVPTATASGGAPVDLPPTERDPLEGFNRAMWGFNNAVDKVVLKPAATVYRTVIPRPARRGLSHVLANLSEPWTAINSALQAKPKRMLNAIGRFMVNTTLGVGGLADPASKLGLKPEPEDFGQTLAVWGAKTSTYLVLPLLGPSTIRDGIGSGVARFADPYRIALRHVGLTRTQGYGVVAFEAVDARSNLIDSGADAILKSSADPYATARSAYLQGRAQQIADQDDDAGGASSGGSGDASVDAALKELDDNSPAAGDAAAPAPATPHQDTPTPVAPK